MKFYVMEITTYNDGTKDAAAVYTYESQDEAVANYHSKMGGAMKNAKYQSELITVTAGNGNVILTDFWTRQEEDNE